MRKQIFNRTKKILSILLVVFCSIITSTAVSAAPYHHHHQGYGDGYGYGDSYYQPVVMQPVEVVTTPAFVAMGHYPYVGQEHYHNDIHHEHR